MNAFSKWLTTQYWLNSWDSMAAPWASVTSVPSSPPSTEKERELPHD